MTETRTRTVRFDVGRSVELTLTEAGTGRTALVLHGGGGPATVQSIAAHLSGAMHVLTPVLPGWNGTARPGWLSAVGDLAAAYSPPAWPPYSSRSPRPRRRSGRTAGRPSSRWAGFRR